MARPVKQRRVCEMPETMEFAPCNKEKLMTIEMSVDEYEVIRLIDHLKLTQNECSQQMSVARTTVQAIYDSARSKLADALVNGKKLLFREAIILYARNPGTAAGKTVPRKEVCLDIAPTRAGQISVVVKTSSARKKTGSPIK